MKNILIAGGSGFIGSSITNLALERGYKVCWLTRKKMSFKGVTVFNWNPENKKIDDDVFENIDIVINLCGASISKKWTEDYKRQIMDSRLTSTQFLIEEIKKSKNKPVHFINASAIGIYPYSMYESFYEDDLELGFHFLAEVCKEWEFSTRKITDTSNLTIFRIGVVLDKNRGALPKIISNPYVLGTGRQWFSWIHIDDLCRVFLHSIENKLYGTYNAVSSFPIMQKYLVKTIIKEKNKFTLPLSIPSFIIKKLFTKNQWEMILKGNNVSNLKILDTGFIFEFDTIEKAMKNILNG